MASTTFVNQLHADFTTSLPSSTTPNTADPDQVIPNFTATGRPFVPSKAKHGSGLFSLDTAEGMGLGTPNLLPRRYTDDSLISIPVLPPDTTTLISPMTPTSPISTWSVVTAVNVEDPIKHDAKPGFKFWRTRKPSTSSHIGGATNPSVSGTTKKDRRKIEKFVMKMVTRGDYLKYYAKDDEGRFVGSEAPASDCILRHEADLIKWRTGNLQWKNDF